ncbi:MAG: hypothetical protein KDD67_01885 [Ignavibacteriae bacterium]|nr:hypothetical protein [Ignavibacteriota bacterium]MCB9215431.1 hypothetical protein [Ignavibacteria bacterium]
MDRINDFMQFLDPALLQSDLFGSIWHLHSQPPLHNLLVGLVLNIFPTALQGDVLAGIYTLLALSIILGLYSLCLRRGIRPSIAFVVSAIFSLSPTLIWAERLPIYVLPIMATLVGMAIVLQKYVATRRPLFALLFIAGIVYLPLTRSFFHLLVWMLPLLIGFLLLARNIDRRRFALYTTISIVGFLLVGGLYTKNKIEYGAFTGSTWQGMNIQGLTALVPEENIRQLVDEGTITPLALMPRFSPPGEYYRYYHYPPQHHHPALDDTLRSTGYINWNNRIYADAGRESEQNTLRIAQAYPLKMFLGVVNQFYLFCGVKSYQVFNAPSRWWIPRSDSLGHLAVDLSIVYLIPLFVFLLIGSTLFRFVRTFRRARQKRGKWNSADHSLFASDLFIGFALLYILTIACLAELGEGGNMRVQVDPFLALTVGIIIERFASRKAITDDQQILPQQT